MKFVIQGLKYDTDKMKKIANVKKWYETNSPLVKAIYGNREVGTTYDCELWRSEKRKLAFDAYRGLQQESRKRHNRRGSKKPFNEIYTGYLRNRV